METEAVASDMDVARVRRQARKLAGELGFSPIRAEEVALAATELATNLVRYAADGTISIAVVLGAAGDGIQLEACDHGPGIRDVAWAMLDGTTSGGGLGSGLPAVRRLMDTFELTSGPQGTRIVACKWPLP